MAEYIDRSAGVSILRAKANMSVLMDAAPYFEKAAQMLEKLPAADVAPVVHGWWVRPHWKNSNYCCDCSECGEEAMHRDYQWDKNGVYPICPNCGAKMDGGDRDAAD